MKKKFQVINGNKPQLQSLPQILKMENEIKALIQSGELSPEKIMEFTAEIESIALTIGNEYAQEQHKSMEGLEVAKIEKLFDYQDQFWTKQYSRGIGAGKEHGRELLGPRKLQCPQCAYEFMRAEKPEHINSSDNYKAGWSGQGDLIKIPIQCEAGCRWYLCIGNHKGDTVIFATTKDEKNPYIEEPVC